jgi:peptidoglycan/LPS O-acetylase OafA/YrhL
MIYRPEIDGLRAIAVLGVLFFHCGFLSFSGGYVGVDVFFVISGYLITKNISISLVDETFSFRRFYLARLRRLYPALLATVAGTLFFASFLFTPPLLAKLAASAVASVMAFSNIYFWQEVGYWDLEVSLKPLLHIWSLSVEEQFYFVWPLLLWVASRMRAPRVVIPAVVAICGIASLCAASDFGRASTFYWMPLRAFEFAIGASIIWLEMIAMPRVVREIDALVGFGAVAYAMLLFNEQTAFPYAGALYPCVGTALMIYAGNSVIIARLWNNWLMVAIGRISYSLYMVHWPICVLYAYWRFGPLVGAEKVGLVVASVIIAIPMHIFVEKRFRYAKSGSNLGFVRSIVVATCIVIALAGSAWHTGGWPWRHFARPVDTEMLARIALPCENGVGLCPGLQKVVLIGDSHAGSIKIFIADALKRARMGGAVYPTVTNCFFLGSAFPVHSLDSISTSECPSAEKQWRERIEVENPEVVILAGFWIAGLDPSVSGLMVQRETIKWPTFAESRALFERQMKENVDWLTSSGRKVIIIGTSPMVDKSPAICYERTFGSADCSKLNVLSKPETHAATTAFLKSLRGPNVLYVDLMAALCKDEVCTLGKDGNSFYLDRHHLSAYGEMWLADQPLFQDVVEFFEQAAAR